MISFRISTVAIVVMALSGCVVHVPAPPAHRTSSAQPVSSDAVQLVSSAVQACERVQRSASVPIGCMTDVVDDVPAMYIMFLNNRDAGRYMDAVAERVAGPFCAGTKQAHLNAVVIVGLMEESLGALYSCPDGRWSPWEKIQTGRSPSFM